MIFFLDIDGVMVHANPHKKVELEEDGFYKFNYLAVEILKSSIYKTKDEIILSSSHRFKYDIKQWKKIFKTRGISINTLSIIDNKDFCQTHRVTRRSEIVNWIHRKNLKNDEFVIIDDDKSLNDLPSSIKNRLVLTNSYTGLSNFHDLEEILNRKIHIKTGL